VVQFLKKTYANGYALPELHGAAVLSKDIFCENIAQMGVARPLLSVTILCISGDGQ
jgi:hypothetical protein